MGREEGRVFQARDQPVGGPRGAGNQGISVRWEAREERRVNRSHRVIRGHQRLSR